LQKRNARPVDLTTDEVLVVGAEVMRKGARDDVRLDRGD
jgi:hypothetical protein